MRGPLGSLAAAWIFLTRIPLPRLDLGEKEFAAAPGFYPLVGVLIGVLGAIGYTVGLWIGGNGIGAIFAIVTTLMVTGAFHEDGLADVFDGLGAYDAARMMEIMRDSRLGTFGAAALFCVLTLKAACLASLSPLWVCAALPVAHGTSRLSAVVVIRTSRYVRAEGIAKPVAAGIAKGPLALAVVTGLLATGLFAVFFPVGAVVAGVVGLAIGHVAMRLVFERRLGGYTGDCLGAVQQTSELGFYLGLLAWF